MDERNEGRSVFAVLRRDKGSGVEGLGAAALRKISARQSCGIWRRGLASEMLFEVVRVS